MSDSEVLYSYYYKSRIKLIRSVKCSSFALSFLFITHSFVLDTLFHTLFFGFSHLDLVCIINLYNVHD